MTDPESLGILEDENNRRLTDLQQGMSGGLPVQFPPGALDLMKLTVFVEILLGDQVWTAREAFAEKLSDQLDEIEMRAREAKLTHGTGIIGANGQTPPMQ